MATIWHCPVDAKTKLIPTFIIESEGIAEFWALQNHLFVCLVGSVLGWALSICTQKYLLFYINWNVPAHPWNSALRCGESSNPDDLLCDANSTDMTSALVPYVLWSAQKVSLWENQLFCSSKSDLSWKNLLQLPLFGSKKNGMFLYFFYFFSKF